MNSSEASDELDKSRSLRFLNRRAEWWWKFREALDPASGEDLMLPPDPMLKADLCAPRWSLQARGIQVEPKFPSTPGGEGQSLSKRLGRSPDRGDAVVLAWAKAANVVNLRERKRPGERKVPVHTASWVA